ncbi:MAG: nucleoside phosphorylase [Sediminicola sp.]
MTLSPSEFILNGDGSIYHLNLLPDDLAQTVITVGDPDRVPEVSKYFDTIALKKGKREFLTHTGTLNGKILSVVSTGIGTDNVDIVLNELDALANIDFKDRTVKRNTRRLDIIRIGTSGAIHPDISVDSFLMSEYAMGLDSLLQFYDSGHVQNTEIQKAFMDHSQWDTKKSAPYVVRYNDGLGEKLASPVVQKGFTVTNVGFYGPQGRVLRLPLQDPDLNQKLASFRFGQLKLTNLEMETAGIYGLSRLLGHRAVSMNCILANRSTGEFSKRPQESIDALIQYTLQKLTE